MPSATTISVPASRSAEAIGFRRDHDEHRRLVEGSKQLGVEGQASFAVEDDPNRLPTGLKTIYISTFSPVDAGGEQWIVG